MAVVRLTLRHPGGATPVVVGAGALAEFGAELEAWLAGRTAFVVTTPRVWELHGPSLAPVLAAAASWRLLEVPDGEHAKSLASAEHLWSEMLARGGKRDSGAIAFGGGAVGDLTGFTAGCFLRGISLVQLPTTLLAQVDAAIGGKSGINMPAAKNCVGLFYHPWAVVADTGFLATLPGEELRGGLLEVVKVGVILDRALFERVEADLDGLLEGDAAALAPVVAAAAKAKIEIVERDPDERDLRRLLNFGHTLGHALESSLDYQSLRHGEAVGYGMLFALRLAVRRGLQPDAARRVRRLIARFPLPNLPALDAGELLAGMQRDKKARESGLTWVLPRRLGAGHAITGIDHDELRRELAEFLAEPLAEA